jgi:glucokinase
MKMYREEVYTDLSVHKRPVYLVGDIGGTNANFAFFLIDGGVPKMLRSVHYKSREITDFTVVVQDVLAHGHKELGVTITTACLAAAGVISEQRDFSKPTNASFVIDVGALTENTSLRCVTLANDFEVIGYGLDLIDASSVIPVHRGAQQKKGNKAILGAGTGLGKCILVWDKDRNYHIPVASEGGHADFAPHNELELELVTFIKETENFTCPVSWEDVLSGNGIQRIYRFFKKLNNHQSSHASITDKGPHPDEIFNSRTLDDHSARTFELYAALYGRCAKNFALDALALGGVYIAGGIAAKNIPFFQQTSFLQEFTACGKQRAILMTMPLFVIRDYNVSLYGAFEYMRREGLCEDFTSK